MKAPIEFITASAGSGKTFRLVEIVADAVMSQAVRPEGVVATTFTVAAANELRERISARFHAVGRHDDAVRLGSGMIGTVHGICLDLLSRFALEAGISPEVKILDDAQAQVLLSRAFNDVLSDDEESVLYDLSDRLTQTKAQSSERLFRSVIPDLVASSRSNDIAPSALPAIGAANWAEMKAALPDPTSENLDAELLAAIQAALGALDANTTVAVIQRYLQLLRQCRRALVNGTMTWADWNKLASETPGKAKANLAIAQGVLDVAARLGEHPRFHQDLETYLTLVFKIARDLADRFSELKRESGAADFADLEKEALDLLTHSPEVRQILTDEIDLLVVDEFQDTSPIQLALFSRLAECAKRVVWVGDVKQAIYGFRGADPELIMAAVAKARKSGSLDQSWRSSPDLVHWVNEMFAEPFAERLGLPRNEVVLTPHRGGHPEARPALRVVKVTSDEYGQNGNLKTLRNSERHALTADAIVDFLHRGEQIIDKASITGADPVGTLRPVTPRDIAVLVRTRDHARCLANELRARGVDVSHSTSGMLAAPECQLALACLRVLVDARDSLAAAEVVAFDVNVAPEVWLLDRLEYLQQRSDAADGASVPPWGTAGPLVSPSLKGLVAARSGMGIAQLGPLALYDLAYSSAAVERIVVAWGPTQQRAEQRMGNLSRLREWIAEYQSSASATGAPASLNGLFAWLADLSNERGANDARDKRAVDPEIDAVHIGTYHGAKGLEWPVVFVTGMETEARSNLFSLRSHGGSVAFDMDRPLEGRSLRLWINPFGRAKAVVRDQFEASPVAHHAWESSLSEELRLLYVGLTRARDTLVWVHDPAREPKWLELAGDGRFLTDDVETLTLSGRSFSLELGRFTPTGEEPHPTPVATLDVPQRAATRTLRDPLMITPSSRVPLNTAAVASVVEFGSPMAVSSRVNARDYGDAMHRILAVEISHPDPLRRLARASRILAHWGLDDLLKVEDVLAAVDAYRQWIDESFQPLEQFVEVPFGHVTPEGQQSNGFIDHLLLTPDGPVIIDHKIFPGGKPMWEQTALSYSGQLALYRQVVAAAYPDEAPPQCWIHLASAAAAIEVHA